MVKEYIVKSKAVFDGKTDRPEPGAFLIRDGRIAKCLLYEDQTSYGCPVYDFGDRLMMPSFIDAHTHIFNGAIAASEFVCTEIERAHSQQECVEMIREFAAKHPEQKRIRGMGWFVGNWGNAPLPDKRSLDEALPDRPVYLQCADCHSFWLNSAALKEAGIKPDPDFPNGVIGTFENGELSGLLMEPAACEPAAEKYLDFTEEEKEKIHRNFQNVLASYGIAAVSEMFADDYTDETMQNYSLLKNIDEKEGLFSHVFCYMKLFGYTDFSAYHTFRKALESAHFHIAGVKGFIDGVTETYTGLLLEPYTDRPDTCGDGLPLWPKERMQQEIIAANREGIQVRLHCIADGSVRMALDLYEESVKINGKSDVKNTIEHIENIHPDDLFRFKELGVVASMQPYHVTLSQNDKVYRIGEERCRYEWPIRTLIDHGAFVAVGTDFPVVTIDPFKTIYAAVTRKGDHGETVCHNPWETLTMEEVLKAYTIHAAEVYHAQDQMGTLEEGKMADIIVLSQNLFEIPAEQIEDTRVTCNIFEGNVLFGLENGTVKAD